MGMGSWGSVILPGPGNGAPGVSPNTDPLNFSSVSGSRRWLLLLAGPGRPPEPGNLRGFYFSWQLPRTQVRVEPKPGSWRFPHEF